MINIDRITAQSINIHHVKSYEVETHAQDAGCIVTQIVVHTSDGPEPTVITLYS